MKRLSKKLRCAKNGFVLIELLAVVAILGILTAVAIPNVGQFINEGKTKSYEAEFHNIQTAVKAMMADSRVKRLDRPVTLTADMTLVTVCNGAHSLDEYLIGLDARGYLTSGYTYAFAVDGIVYPDNNFEMVGGKRKLSKFRCTIYCP